MASVVVIHRQAENLLSVVYPTLRNFPVSERHRLCARLFETLTAIVSCAARAETVPSKRAGFLQEAQGHLLTLKVMLDLSHREGFISPGFHTNVCINMSEINKLIKQALVGNRSVKPD